MKFWTKKRVVIFSLVALVVAIAAVAILGFGSKKQTAEALPEKKADEANVTMVLVQEFQRQNVPEYVQVSGVLQGIAQVEMIAGVSGQLRALHKNMGDWVEKGQSIGDIDADVYKAEYDQAKALFEIAKNNLKAGKRLYRSKKISDAEYQEILGNFASSQANLEMKRNSYDYARMAAPVSGFITDLPVEVGQSIGSSSFVCKVVDDKKLLLNTGVGEASILKIEEGQKVDVSPDGSDLLLSGSVIGAGKAPACNSAVYPVKIELPGSKGLLAGMTVTAQIAVGEFANVKAVIYDALVQEYDDFYVFRLNQEDNTVAKTKVVVKKMVGNVAIVESALEDGDFVVIDGADEMEDGQKVSPNFYKSSKVKSADGEQE